MKECNICREIYNDDVKVCPNCGYRFPDVAPAAPQASNAPQNTAQQAQPTGGQAAPENRQQTQHAAPNSYAATYTTQPTKTAAPANAAHKLGWFKFYSLPLVIIMIVFSVLSLFRFVASDTMVAMFSGYLSITGTVLTLLTCILNVAFVVFLFIMVFTLHKFKSLGYTMNLIFLIAYPIYCVINTAYTVLHTSSVFYNDYFTVVLVASVIISFVVGCVFSILNLIYFQKRRYMFYGEAPSKYKASRIVLPLVIIAVGSLIAMAGSYIGLTYDYNSYYTTYDKYDSNDFDYDFDDYDHDDSNDLDHKTVDGATTTQQEALDMAYDYLDSMPFSRTGLIGQLEYEGYSTEDATFAVDNCGADWNAQAAAYAKDYLEYDPTYTHDDLLDMLLFEDFTQSEAEYGVAAVGL